MRRTDTLRPSLSSLPWPDDNRGWRHFGFRHDQHKDLTSDFYLDGLAGKDADHQGVGCNFLVKGSTGRDTITCGKVTDTN